MHEFCLPNNTAEKLEKVMLINISIQILLLNMCLYSDNSNIFYKIITRLFFFKSDDKTTRTTQSVAYPLA